MSVVNNNLLLAAEEGGYRIERSVRLRRNVPTYFSRTPASAGNRRTWTWSAWIKRGHLGAATSTVFDTNSSIGGVRGGIKFISDSFYINQNQTGGSATAELRTTALFRDPSAWYHFVFVWDTTQATASNRMKMYVNGVQITSFTTALYPNQNTDSALNGTSLHKIGADGPDLTDECFDGYLTEINFVDGQALTPSDFGEFNALTGVWQPKRYAGTYGTNGFYLNFKDNASTSTLGTDYSGRGNNWTTNNISLTAGATFDSMIDVPTPYADGGNGRGNYAVLNPLSKNTSTIISNGNLAASGNVIFGHAQSTMFVSSDKWYFEAQLTTQQNDTALGLGNLLSNPQNDFTGGSVNSVGYLSDGRFFYNGSLVATHSSYTTTDVVACAFDCATGKIWIAKNNTWQNSGNPAAGTGQVQTVSWTEFTALARTVGSGAIAFNFGQRPFAYTPPTGFKALNTQNLPEPTIVDGGEYFNAVLWTGDNANPRTISGVGFQPDLTWTKVRSNAGNPRLNDSVRGSARVLFSNTTDAELTTDADGTISAFTSDGFTLQGSSSTQNVNLSPRTYVAWNWKANGAGVTNTAGSITSTVSANPTAGFSVVTYSGNSTAAATVGHGLGVTPSMIITKRRNASSSWAVSHAAYANTSLLFLESSIGLVTGAGTRLQRTNSSVFTVGDAADYNVTNASGGTYVAYCFSEVAGYSRFGSYTGNGIDNDGPFVFCGFRPRFIMVKNIKAGSGVGNWGIFDTARSPINVGNAVLYADLEDAEGSSGLGRIVDVVSNGFKIRNPGTQFNESGQPYIFMAFAEHPFKHALAR